MSSFKNIALSLSIFSHSSFWLILFTHFLIEGMVLIIDGRGQKVLKTLGTN